MVMKPLPVLTVLIVAADLLRVVGVEDKRVNEESNRERKRL